MESLSLDTTTEAIESEEEIEWGTSLVKDEIQRVESTLKMGVVNRMMVGDNLVFTTHAPKESHTTLRDDGTEPERLEAVNMNKKTGGSLYNTESTRERNNIFVGKDIEDRKQTSRDSTKMDVPMQQQTRRMDGDGPAITSSEKDTASLSRLSFTFHILARTKSCP